MAFSTPNLTKEQVTVLAFHFPIGETYFFRDPKAGSAEDEKFSGTSSPRRAETTSTCVCGVPVVAGEKSRYSMAMVLRRLVHDIRKLDIKILAPTSIPPS